MGCSVGLLQVLLLQFRPEDNAQRQAVIRVFEVAAQHGGDVGQTVQEGGAVQKQCRGGFGNGEVVIQVDPKRMQIGHLGMVVMLLQPLQPLGIKDPGGAAGQRAAEELRKQIILEVEDGHAISLVKAVLQGGGCLEPGVICVVEVGKGGGNTADDPSFSRIGRRESMDSFFA